MKRKNILTLFLVLCCMGCMVGGTLAYLTDRSSQMENKFTFGNVDITIQEQFTPPVIQSSGTHTYQKEVWLQNHGNVDAYGRVNLVFSSGDVADISEFSSDGGNTWYPVSEFREHLPDGWVYEEDGLLGGYYYYITYIKPGGSSTPLITHVRTAFRDKSEDTDISINYTPRSYDIYAYAEGVQRDCLKGENQHKNYKDAWDVFLSLKGR